MVSLNCFNSNDIRGQIGDDFNQDIAYAIGQAFAQVRKPKTIVVGADNRLTSPLIKSAVINGLLAENIKVIDIGMTGSEELYFATNYLNACGGIEVTASHNPKHYNGMKLVAGHSKPISNDNGLLEIKNAAEIFLSSSQTLDEKPNHKSKTADVEVADLKTEYAKHMLSFIDVSKLKPLRIVLNSGNGAAGAAIDAIENELSKQGAKIEFIKLHHQADGSFPNGVPNPMLPENRAETAAAVINNNADFGVAFDGDFDRCFFFDETGRFIESYYVVGLLAQAFLSKPNSRNKETMQKIIHDPRLWFNTVEIVKREGGQAMMSKAGHSYIKDKMRSENAIYGGEMSGHHYFREFNYCDSGMIPWLLVTELLSTELLSSEQQSLSTMVTSQINAYPTSGEINLTPSNVNKAIDGVRNAFEKQAIHIDCFDGLSMEFDDWRFNLRQSNTEALLRLNVETRGDKILLKQKTELLLQVIAS
ncbi:phosphomannomutase/phosphoglucomutase [Thalassotalea crassostreae]|uniref:phosphomannomutase/phosphoglucomutase n=1 Tax=Thalassotalea crassostreae TaxID=1763536 RepID=UPI000837BB20|nr:phosphomannomutase/phosphoglucomutase [Thalassotalea crassostreae]